MCSRWWLLSLILLVALGCAAEDQPALERRPMAVLANRETAKAEDMMRHAVVAAQKHFDDMYA